MKPIKTLTDDQVMVELARRGLASLAGQSHAGIRDVWGECGYLNETALTNSIMLERYKLGDVAGPVVDAYPDATWAVDPEIFEKVGKKDTPFEQAIKDTTRKTRLWSVVAAADRLAGLGRYAILLLGFDGGDKLDTEIKKAGRLLYVTALSEDSAPIEEYETEATNPRYGLPKYYKVTLPQFQLGTAASTSGLPQRVHYSRVIHICESRLGDRVFHEPRLRGVWHRLMDLDKLLGGGAEMFWRGAYQGMSFEADANVELTDAAKKAMQDEIRAFQNSLRREMLLQGVKAHPLSPNVKDPGAQVQEQLKFISARTRIPLRILTGSERGELASGQDADEWDDRVRERREQFAEPLVVRPIVDRLVSLGVVPAPGKDGDTVVYQVSWERERQVPEKEAAELGSLRTDALTKYVQGGLMDVIPPYEYFTLFLGMEDDIAKKLSKESEKAAEELARQEETDAKAAEEAQGQEPAAGEEEEAP